MRQFISFYLGYQRYALDILLLKEIGRLNDLSPVPESPEYLLGIMNLRGQILTVMDPQFFLEQKSVVSQQERVLIILKTKNEIVRLNKLNKQVGNVEFTTKYPLAILVDKMGEALAVEEKAILPPLPNVTNENITFISGMIQQNNQFIIVLAIEQLLKRL